jgi:rhamnulose-1-phosphate aldolase
MRRINEAMRREIEKAGEAGVYCWERGWAEGNGGNISVDLTEICSDVLPSKAELAGYEALPISDLPPDSEGKVFYVKGTGRRLRELRDPEYGGGIIAIGPGAKSYSVLWGGLAMDHFRPTSEFPSHVLMHMRKGRLHSACRAVVHTHPIELICLTHHPDLFSDSEELTRRLWAMSPEIRAFVPKGIAALPYILPGSIGLAEATSDAIQTRDVVLWGKHGALAMGPDALEAFDLIDVANKGALMYLKCLSSGYEPIGMSKAETEELARVFKL